jgi:hypothetical protein
MKRQYITCILSIIAFLLFINSYSQKHAILVDAHNKHIKIEGRVNISNTGVAEIYWSGTSCKIKFKGTELNAVLKDERGHNYYNIIIDGDSIEVLKLDTAKRTYLLASNLEEGDNTIELFRRTGWTSGRTWFYGFQLPPHSKILDLPVKTKSMEFYGNSIQLLPVRPLKIMFMLPEILPLPIIT